ncbi:hypothetical protein [Embleya sp. NPDC059259]|uniref:hypothetical protein n=1 Tax=unclassified Embleya TaxID=2699296 RepID=UPI0036C92FA4
MNDSGAESTEVPAGEGIHRIPATVTVVTEVPAASDARDALLRAIGAEAQLVAEKSAGQASTALVELAHAYALVIAGAPTGEAGPVKPGARYYAPWLQR